MLYKGNATLYCNTGTCQPTAYTSSNLSLTINLSQEHEHVGLITAPNKTYLLDQSHCYYTMLRIVD